jgi:D-tyrosyl-tRNA(Tyr) deacylase
LRAVVQRVAEARVTADGKTVGEIGPGLCVLLGVSRDDDAAAAERLAGQVARLRIFANDEGKFDGSVLDSGGSVLVVSNFTLVAETAKGNRPSFSEAAEPAQAEMLYESFCVALREVEVPVETGVFGARMRLDLANEGPVTIVLETS